MKRCIGVTAAALAVAGLFGAAEVRAHTVPLGSSGWEAVFDDSLVGYVDVVVDLVTPDAVYIQKSAEFTQGPGPGGFPAIAILFRQTSPDAVGQIVINDEIITNSTGYDWTDFHFQLVNMGDALFDPSSVFTTSPFDNQYFSPDLTEFSVDGFGLGPGGTDAIIPNGGIWFPGDGASDGELVIDVTTHAQAPFTVFTLKETPTPEPSSVLLLVAGAALLRRR
jgi:hypothetical protein